MLVLVDISYNLHDKSEKTKKKLTKAIFSLLDLKVFKGAGPSAKVLSNFKCPCGSMILHVFRR